MEYRNIDHCFQLALNLKAARCGNILQIDAAEAACDQRNGLAEFLRILRTDAERNRLHPAELGKECAFALHDRHCCERTDITETEDSSSVRDDGNEIGSAGQIVGQRRILFDLQTRTRNARRICDRESLLVLDRDL